MMVLQIFLPLTIVFHSDKLQGFGSPLSFRGEGRRCTLHSTFVLLEKPAQLSVWEFRDTPWISATPKPSVSSKTQTPQPAAVNG